jgi:predicted transcriptional regulator
MRKTTVYLDDGEAEALRQLAATTGVSQAELIREAIRHAVANVPARKFRSLGIGQGTGRQGARWSATELYDKAFGRADLA